MLDKSIGSEARLTGFKSQFSHLLGLGIKFGPIKEYVNTYQTANNRQSTRFIFFIPDKGTVPVSFTYVQSPSKKSKIQNPMTYHLP